MDSQRILIAGGGIGGLATALALRRAGIAATVLEQAPDLREVGAGLTITPNGSRALAALGLAAGLDEIGSAPASGAIRHYSTGATLVPLIEEDARARHGAPIYHVHRADLQSLLAFALESRWPGTVRTACEVVGLRQGASSVTVELRGGECVAGDALVAADGIRSRVRELCFGEEQPAFAGFVAFRGLVRGETLAPELKEPPISFWVGPGRSFMRYRLRGGRLYNYVAIARRAAWADEGWMIPARVEDVLAEFHDFEPRVHGILAATPSDRLFGWGLFEREPLPCWRQGRVTLLGDAAHAMPPFLGQGAVMALEDAVVLGRAFAETGTVDQALDAYEAARRPRTSAVFRLAQQQGAVYHAADPVAQIAALGRSMAEQRTYYDYDATQVALGAIA